MKATFLAPLALLIASTTLAQLPPTEFTAAAKISHDVRSRRSSSFDRTGGNADNVHGVKPGAKVDILNVQGAGIISHIWITCAPGADKLDRNDIILRMYWDGNTFPSVEAPLGAFFGNGWGEAYNFVSAPLAVTPGWGKSYVSYFAMPFAKGARIELENQTDIAIDALYYNIDYVEVPQLDPTLGRFHAWYNHQLTEALPGGENE